MRALGTILLFCFDGWIRVHNVICLLWPTPWSCNWFYFPFFGSVFIYVFFEFNLMFGITFPFFFVMYFWCLLYFSGIEIFCVILLFVDAWRWTISWWYEAAVTIIVIFGTLNDVIVIVGRSAYISINEVIICRFSTSW